DSTLVTPHNAPFSTYKAVQSGSDRTNWPGRNMLCITTLLLSTIDRFVPTEHLMLGYLLPTILVAIYFGSTLAVLTSFASGLAAAYFLLRPKFSFYIDEPLHIAELGFTIVLAVSEQGCRRPKAVYS